MIVNNTLREGMNIHEETKRKKKKEIHRAKRSLPLSSKNMLQ